MRDTENAASAGQAAPRLLQELGETLQRLRLGGPFYVLLWLLAGMASGVWERATLRGGLIVDAPVRLDRVTPAWGPQSGDTTITVHGEGFEPGTTVSEGLAIRIGDVPVRTLRVLASDRLEIVAPGGSIRWRIIDGRRLERATSAGAEWQPVTLPAAGSITAVAAPSPSVCWVVGSGGGVYLRRSGNR